MVEGFSFEDAYLSCIMDKKKGYVFKIGCYKWLKWYKYLIIWHACQQEYIEKDYKWIIKKHYNIINKWNQDIWTKIQEIRQMHCNLFA